MMINAPSLTSHRQAPARFTAAEFMELVGHPPISDWLGKVELVDGVIVRMSPANIPHWSAQRLIMLRLQSALTERGFDWVVGQEPTVRLAVDTIREPDVAVLVDPDLSDTIFDRAALFLAIEVADSSRKIDLGTKLRDYAKAFVPHYWVVDLKTRLTLVMDQPRGGRYLTSTPYAFGQPIIIPGTDATIVIE